MEVQGVAFWRARNALRATDEAVVSVREGPAEATGGTVASVENYEVFVNEASSAGRLARSRARRRGDGHGGRGHATGKRGHRHGERNHGQPPGGRREEKLAKGGQRVATQGEARAGTDNTPALLLLALIHPSAWKVTAC